MYSRESWLALACERWRGGKRGCWLFLAWEEKRVSVGQKGKMGWSDETIGGGGRGGERKISSTF